MEVSLGSFKTSSLSLSTLSQRRRGAPEIASASPFCRGHPKVTRRVSMISLTVASQVLRGLHLGRLPLTTSLLASFNKCLSGRLATCPYQRNKFTYEHSSIVIFRLKRVSISHAEILLDCATLHIIRSILLSVLTRRDIEVVLTDHTSEE